MRITRPEEIYAVFTPLERGLLAIKGVKEMVQQYDAEHADESLHDDAKFDPYDFVECVRELLSDCLPEEVFVEMMVQGKLEDMDTRLKRRLHAYANHTE
jgi:hypothetical protein